MSTKILEGASIKAAVDQTTTKHTIEFYMLAFSTSPDKQGDRIAPSAVDSWLAEFYKAGRPLPISFAHAAVRDSTDPFAIVGSAPADPDHVWKDDYGVRVLAELDTDTNTTAQQVFTLAKRGVVTGASVAYFVPEDGEKLQRDGSTLITKMEILEAGPCLDPANPDAYVIAVKQTISAIVAETPGLAEVMDAQAQERVNGQVVLPLDDALAFKAGRRISAATAAALRSEIAMHLEAAERLRALLGDDPETETSAKGNAEEPETANAEDPLARFREGFAVAER